MEQSASEKPIRLGIKIEKPSDVKIKAIYPFLLSLSLVLIAATAWLLALEYLGKPPVAWLRALL